jgi:chorismate mutase
LGATPATPEVANGEVTVTEDDNLTTSQVLSLDSIRSSLIRQEETIIFALIERAQFRHNPIVYQKGGLGTLATPPGSTPSHNKEGEEQLSFLEYILMGTEALHYAVRRYTSPEEHAFFPERLPSSKKVLKKMLEYPQDLLSNIGGAGDVNFNQILLKKYIDVIVPDIAHHGDDEQHGSSVLCDVAVLQALSRRVHYGKFVAESKYLADPDEYQKLVDAGDAVGVMKLLTNEKVEAKVLRRARLKAATYGTEPLLAELPPLRGETEMTSIVASAAASAVVAAIEAMGDDSKTTKKVCPSTTESVYRDIIIPLTKDIEVAYLFRRCGREPPPEFGPDRMSTDVA